MRYKMTKNIKFVVTRFVFFSSAKYTKIRFRSAGAPLRTPLGQLMTLPLQTPASAGEGRGIPPPHFPSPRLGAYNALVLRPPQHKFLTTPVPSPPPLFTQNLTTVTLSIYSLPKSQTNRLQLIQNSLARVVVKDPESSHISYS